MKFRFVREHRETFRVGMMCRVLRVSRSGYYACCRHMPGLREREDRQLVERIREVDKASREIYGMPSSGRKGLCLPQAALV